MAVVAFTLNPEALVRLHDALLCLGKFSEIVTIEAKYDKLLLTALNSSKSAYASITLSGNKFLSKYQFGPICERDHPLDKFTCKIYNKALLAVFKGRTVDSTKDNDTSIERCEILIEDGPEVSQSRFVVKIICKHGILKTHRLIFERCEPVHALFVKETANNYWSISSRTLREFVDHFGPGTEYLDIYSEDGRVGLTSYTEKIVAGKEVLKQPLQTTITIDSLEFGEFVVEEKLHIVISVKDFKSIIAHAGITNTTVKGINIEFILMTTGDARNIPTTSIPRANPRSNSKLPNERPANNRGMNNQSRMGPPPVEVAPSITREAKRIKVSRPSPPPPEPSIQSQALFYPEADDERRWDVPNYDDEDDEALMWDGSGTAFDALAANSGSHLQHTARLSQRPSPNISVTTQTAHDLVPTQRLEPTQRLSEVRGLFDD